MLHGSFCVFRAIHRLTMFVGVLLISVLFLHTATASTDVPQEAATPPQLLMVPGFEEPFIASGPTTTEENQALTDAIATYRKQTVYEDFTVFNGFLSQYPQSGWRVALLTNLGIAYYHYGFFSRTIDTLEQAWQAGRNVTEPRAKALVDRAVGELARMHARLGHADALEKLLQEIGDRPITGPATETITGAREGLWMFRHDPGVAYLCGPKALKNFLLAQGASNKKVAFLDEARSGPHGFSLAQVAQLADKAKLEYKLIYREPGQPIPVPSVVNWKVHHFAAIVGEDKDTGRYHLQDPTFASGDMWLSKSAIDAESSGYFLVAAAQADAGYRIVGAKEATQVYGMGQTSNNVPGATTPDDKKLCGSQNAGGANPNPGMCAYSVHAMVVSLNLNDTPVGYAPSKGPAMYVTLTYNQREANQPANFSFFNISSKWTLNWLTYIQDDPSRAGSNVLRYVGGGGSINYAGYNATTGAFTAETRTAAVLVRNSGTSATYRRLLSDGTVELYAQSDGAVTYPRRIFLTQITDPSGNVVTLNYDSQMRLTSIVDATGRSTTFSYGIAAKPLLITSITDPFGRRAQIAYDNLGRLVQITDVIGIASRFAYDSSGLVNALTTPYGTTNFTYGGTGNYRWLEATDPLGKTERVEYIHGVPAIPFNESLVPAGINAFNSYINYRNTYFWDKYAYQTAKGDYTRAQIMHWLHDAATGLTAPVLESSKAPLENRIWFNYPGQPSAIYDGTLDKPSATGRVLDNGTTQLTRMNYNSFGKPTGSIDPSGRETQFVYATNQIDLLQVKQKTSASGFSILAQFTYNSQHLPLTYTDASGQTTSFSYNAAGRPLTVTDPLGHSTTYTYDGLNRLISVINADNVAALTLTYDGYDRVATRTDSEGHTISYTYDALDRSTQVAYPDGTSDQFTWTNLDLTAVTDRQSRTTSYSYDANRKLIGVTDPLGRHTAYAYYPNGALKSLTDANGHTSSWDIDIQSRVTAKHYADGKTDAVAYENTTSRMKKLTDALSQMKNFTYGLDNRLTGVAYTNAVNPTPNVSFAYDPYLPRLTSMIDGTGTTAFQYRPIGSAGALQPSSVDGPYTNDTVGYSYDALGRVIQRTVDSSSESFTYDALGRTTAHVSPLGSNAMSYLGETGQIARQALNGGTVGSAWSYDSNLNDRRLTKIDNSSGARDYNYTISPVNIINKIAESANAATAWPLKTWNYGYDNADRLTQAQASSGALYNYGQDNADNLTSIKSPAGTTSASYNSVNQATTFGSQSFSYDAAGNLTDDGVRTYKWDAENRLIGIGYKATPTRGTSFRYDGMGRRIAIVETVGTASTETRYLWCGEEICQARTSTDVVTRRYYPEGEVWPATGTLLYYARDHLGSVRDVAAVQNGSRVASYDYDPYGNPSQTAGMVSTSFRYAGMFYHQGSGLYLTQYRVYEPRTGRWLSRDPIGEKGGLNLYAYVGGDPLSFSDSTGLSEEWDLCMKATGRADACRLPRGEDWRDVTVGPTAAGSASIGFTGYVTSIPEFSACMAASLLPDFATGKAMEVGLKEMTKAGGKAIGLMCKAVPVIGNISTGYDILQCYKESQVWTDYHPTGTYGWGR